MVKKFQSLYRSQIVSKSLSKAAFLTLVLFGVRYFDFPIWTQFVFVLASLGVYLTLPPDRVYSRASYAILTLLGFAGVNLVESFSLAILFFLAFGVLTFVFLGLQNFQFSDRFSVYGIWNTGLLLFLSLEIFYFSDFLKWWTPAILFLVLVPIFNEALGFFRVVSGRPRLASAAALAYLGATVAFFLPYLPLGFVNSAVFLTLFLLLARDILLFHFQGNLSFFFVLKELTFFIVIGTLVFAASRWSI